MTFKDVVLSQVSLYIGLLFRFIAKWKLLNIDFKPVERGYIVGIAAQASVAALVEKDSSCSRGISAREK